jgi:hypothetical protein
MNTLLALILIALCLGGCQLGLPRRASDRPSR